MHRRNLIFALTLASSAALGAHLLTVNRSTEANHPLAAVEGYLRATYARDFGRAYDGLSTADQRVRTRQSFVGSQGSFSGFTLEVAQRLASFMKIWQIERRENPGRILLKVGYRVPAPAELNGLLLDWDQVRLNLLTKEKQQELLGELDTRHKNGRLLDIAGQETVELIEEAGDWKVFLDWAAATRVLLQSKLFDGHNLDVRFAATEVMAKDGELFLVNVKIKNPAARAVTLTVSHRLEPAEVADDLQLVECGLLTPTTLEAKQEKEFAMAYQLNTAPAQNHREIRLTYEFTLK